MLTFPVKDYYLKLKGNGVMTFNQPTFAVLITYIYRITALPVIIITKI